jgi:hypothetical protein
MSQTIGSHPVMIVMSTPDLSRSRPCAGDRFAAAGHMDEIGVSQALDKNFRVNLL